MENNLNKTVLVVEDEATLLKALVFDIERGGYTVLQATNGEEGMKTALEKHPDLIITDIKMPKMDGLTMLKEIRKDEWGKGVPIIVLTNMDTEDNIKIGLENSVFDFLVKSNTTLDDLLKQVKQKLS